jgi:DNA-binding NarL/FixJ family response regulator
VLLADQGIGNAGIVSHLLCSEFQVVGMVYNGQAAVTATLALKPDVLVIDIILPILHGLDVIRRLATVGVKSKIIVLTAVEDPEYVEEALKAGASGYVFKRRIASDLLLALREALAGGIFVSPARLGNC